MITHIQPAARGLVRIAAMVTVRKKEAKAPGDQGHTSLLAPTTASTPVAAPAAQNAPTGRTRVISTGVAAISPITSELLGATNSSVLVDVSITTRNARRPTTACGRWASDGRIRSGSRRVTGPSVRIGDSGRYAKASVIRSWRRLWNRPEAIRNSGARGVTREVVSVIHTP